MIKATLGFLAVQAASAAGQLMRAEQNLAEQKNQLENINGMYDQVNLLTISIQEDKI